MTAEVAIMNRAAVALAADSAVTVKGESSDSSNIPKIYTSVNKVFALSKYHPVGVMIYGGADILGRPWEPIIKIYREILSDRSFDSLFDYAYHFAKNLPQPNFFPDDVQRSYYSGHLLGYYQLIASQINDSVKAHIEKNGKISNREIGQIASLTITNHYDNLSALKYVKGMSSRTSQSFAKNFEKIISEAITNAFQKLNLSIINIERLKSIGCLLYTKEVFPSSTSGVVIAGFGNKDIFPSLLELEVETIVADKLKYREKSRYSISLDNTAVIYPFAQYDVVHTLLKGIHPDCRNVLESYLRELLDKYPEYIAETLPEKFDAEKGRMLRNLRDAGKELLKEFSNRMDEYSQKNYVLPIIKAVASLPKTELADTAEALVSLTSFKRRVSTDAETVAGPVDVALVSKGDGFIWISRKHYFKSELNYAFFQNYFRK